MTLQSHEESPPDSHDGSPVVLWAAPMISVVSVSTVIVGWFWNKRQRLCRMDKKLQSMVVRPHVSAERTR